jgi:hypothetical protein
MAFNITGRLMLYLLLAELLLSVMATSSIPLQVMEPLQQRKHLMLNT